jgi:uncharacterized SAM-binding protein YcdF (DUF218 family)
VTGGQEVQAAFDAVWDHLVIERPVEAADAIFCFGSRHWRVPERAAALHRAGVAPWVLVTGGPAPGDDLTEAARFRAALEAAGVPSRAIVEEPTAAHTGENVERGMAALGRVVEPSTLVLVSWPLAMRRCLATFEHRHPELVLGTAPALARPEVRWWPTPRRVRFALGEVDRLDRYAAAGHLAPQRPPAGLPEAVALLRAHLEADQRTTRLAT